MFGFKRKDWAAGSIGMSRAELCAILLPAAFGVNDNTYLRMDRDLGHALVQRAFRWPGRYVKDSLDCDDYTEELVVDVRKEARKVGLPFTPVLGAVGYQIPGREKHQKPFAIWASGPFEYFEPQTGEWSEILAVHPLYYAMGFGGQA